MIGNLHCPILDQDGEFAAGLPYKLELPGNYHTCPAALQKKKIACVSRIEEDRH